MNFSFSIFAQFFGSNRSVIINEWPVDSKFFERYQTSLALYISSYVNGYGWPSTYDRQPIIICQRWLVRLRRYTLQYFKNSSLNLEIADIDKWFSENNENIGHPNCRDAANHSESCPKYADNACASTSAVHRLTAGELAYEVHKSCSPFNFGNDRDLDCFGLDMNQGDEKVHFDVCKVNDLDSNLTTY